MDRVDDMDEMTRALVENHRAFLQFLQRRVGRRDLAEDILQEAFARGLGKLDEVRDGEAVIAWFYRLLRHAVIDHHRRLGASDRALAALATEMADEHVVPQEVREEACRCVARLASTLKPEYAEALQEIEVDGLSVKEFAEKHDLTPSNAGVRVFRARDALRRHVTTSCGTCAEHGCLSCTCGSV